MIYCLLLVVVIIFGIMLYCRMNQNKLDAFWYNESVKAWDKEMLTVVEAGFVKIPEGMTNFSLVIDWSNIINEFCNQSKSRHIKQLRAIEYIGFLKAVKNGEYQLESNDYSYVRGCGMRWVDKKIKSLPL